MWWAIVSVSYAVIGLTVFKLSYARFRGKSLAELEKAQLLAGAHQRRMSEEFPKGPQYGADGYHRWYSLHHEHERLKRYVQTQRDKVRHNGELGWSQFVAALWPLSLVALISYGLWLTFKYTLFRGGLDKAAKKRAARVTAQIRTELEEQERRDKIMQLGMRELEES